MLLPAARRDALRRRLLAWYDAGHRELPWRFPQCGADAYRVWLAEVMLQQTQVAAVIPYYRRFLERWPSLEALAAASDDEVLAAWSGLGYYARCRNLLSAAREALRRHGGLPVSLEALRALPGFGPYTAGAVASIAFGIRAPVVDGNVARVLARACLVDGDPADLQVRRRLWALAEELVPPARPGDFNQSLMELGATRCRSREPQCRDCPIAAVCAARRAGCEREVPQARRRANRKYLRVACAVIERGGSLLVARREKCGLFGGLWELPSAEVHQGVAPETALATEVARRLAVRAIVGAQVASVNRTLTHRELALCAFRCRLQSELRPRTAGEVRWVEGARMGEIAMSTAMRELVEALPNPGAKTRPRGSLLKIPKNA